MTTNCKCGAKVLEVNEYGCAKGVRIADDNGNTLELHAKSGCVKRVTKDVCGGHYSDIEFAS